MKVWNRLFAFCFFSFGFIFSMLIRFLKSIWGHATTQNATQNNIYPFCFSIFSVLLDKAPFLEDQILPIVETQ